MKEEDSQALHWKGSSEDFGEGVNRMDSEESALGLALNQMWAVAQETVSGVTMTIGETKKEEAGR